MLADAKKTFSDTLLEALRPDPILTVAEWSDRYRVLNPKGAPEPGPWRTSRTPYLREIMDCLSQFNPIQTVVFKKGSQVGGSECGFNWIGYVMDHAPGPMLMVQPNVGLAERNSRQRIEPMIQDCACLREKVGPKKSRDSSNTLLSKDFPGGILVMGGANSSASLSNMPVRYLFLDEVDRYPRNVDNEGSPIELAIKRTKNFARKKIFIVSTPTIEGASHIDDEFKKSDQRFYFVPCPHCSLMQVLKFERLKWPEGRPELACYHCTGCEKEIKETHKTSMLAQGKWIAQEPGASGGKVAGFHISALYSPVGFGSWEDIARQYEKAKDDPEKLQAFVNTELGETWQQKGDAPEWRRLYERRESYPVGRIPLEAALLVAGADVQKDRIEVEIVAYGPDNESWSIDYRVLMGDTSAPEAGAWIELDKLVEEQFEHASGAMVPIRLLAVDSGAFTQTVYNWARSHPGRVIAVKGFESQPIIIGRPSPVDLNIKGQIIRRGFKVWPVGTNITKTNLYALLKKNKPLDGEPYPPGYCHFPEYEDKYFQGLTAEQAITKKVRGYSKVVWQKIFERNEPLDCRVYARAAAAAAGMDRMRDAHWQILAGQVGAKIKAPNRKEAKQSEDKVKKSN